MDNPLTGAHGRGRGIGGRRRARRRSRPPRWSTGSTCSAPGARDTPGADGGGGGYAALAVLGARLRSGIEIVLDLVGFDAALADADLVVTGKGTLDEQTLHGKAPAGVAAAARAAGVPVVIVCGCTLLTADALSRAGIAAVYRLTDLEPDIKRCMTGAATLLEEIGARVPRHT